MIIAIPVNEDKKTICPAFARAPHMLLLDTVSGEKNAPLNPAASAEGGAGLKAAQFLIDNGIEALITPRCGINSAEVLKEAGISIYKCQGEDAEENSAFFQEGKLSLMEKFHGGFHGKR